MKSVILVAIVAQIYIVKPHMPIWNIIREYNTGSIFTADSFNFADNLKNFAKVISSFQGYNKFLNWFGINLDKLWYQFKNGRNNIRVKSNGSHVN